MADEIETMCDNLLSYSQEVKEDVCESEFGHGSHERDVRGGTARHESDSEFACKVGSAGMMDKIQEEHCI